MALVRTTCPTCDVVIVRAPDLTVRRMGAVSEAVFVCPACDSPVVHPLNERMVPVLVGAGCPVDDTSLEACRARHPSAGADITEDEIDAFVAGLDRFDWFDELAS